MGCLGRRPAAPISVCAVEEKRNAHRCHVSQFRTISRGRYPFRAAQTMAERQKNGRDSRRDDGGWIGAAIYSSFDEYHIVVDDFVAGS